MSAWNAEPRDAMWYGEIIYDWPDGGDCDYSCGYSASVERPHKRTLRDMLPDGRVILESEIRACPSNPKWVPTKKEE